jgi:hypothetical protein
MLHKQQPNSKKVVGTSPFMHYKKPVVVTQMEEILE